MKLASRSAIESESSAKAGSKESKGKAEDVLPPGVKVWLSRNDVRELGRRGVMGREGVLFSMKAQSRLQSESIPCDQNATKPPHTKVAVLSPTNLGA